MIKPVGEIGQGLIANTLFNVGDIILQEIPVYRSPGTLCLFNLPKLDNLNDGEKRALKKLGNYSPESDINLVELMNSHAIP